MAETYEKRDSKNDLGVVPEQVSDGQDGDYDAVFGEISEGGPNYRDVWKLLPSGDAPPNGRRLIEMRVVFSRSDGWERWLS